jgi:hypothetical protein
MYKKYTRAIIALSLVIAILSGLLVKIWLDLKQAEGEAVTVQKTYEGRSRELSEKIDSVDNRILQLQDKYYEEKLTKLLGKEQLISLQKSQWRYVLKVNETPFSDDFIYVTSGEFTLTFTESQLEDKLLPKNMHNKGALINGDDLDKFYDHMTIDTIVPYERKIQKYNNYTNVFYAFKNVPRGTIITLRLSEPLKERLNLGYDKLEIIVNKV